MNNEVIDSLSDKADEMQSLSASILSVISEEKEVNYKIKSNIQWALLEIDIQLIKLKTQLDKCRQ